MHSNVVKVGKIKGTGAILNIECGFIPSYVKLMNVEDAGALAPSLEYFKGMPAASGLKSLSIVDNGTTAKKSTELITSGGISEFPGSMAGMQLTGTVAATSGSATLAGTGTSFLTELAVGDVVKLKDGQEIEISAIASATSATGKTVATASVATASACRLSGKKEGFTLGADADLNVSGEAIAFMAIR